MYRINPTLEKWLRTVLKTIWVQKHANAENSDDLPQGWEPLKLEACWNGHKERAAVQTLDKAHL